jgi:hypothetical protein
MVLGRKELKSAAVAALEKHFFSVFSDKDLE